MGTSERWVSTRKRGNEAVYGGCIFLPIHKNRRMQPVEIVLRHGSKGRGRTMRK
jgi:hypothetical protein